MWAATTLWLAVATSASVSQSALPRDTAVAIYFADESGETKPRLFYDLNAPFQRSDCEARLEYLTKMFYRMTRANPDFKGKTAVRSACVRIEGFDYDS
jgi:hypothetical protein